MQKVTPILFALLVVLGGCVDAGGPTVIESSSPGSPEEEDSRGEDAITTESEQPSVEGEQDPEPSPQSSTVRDGQSQGGADEDDDTPPGPPATTKQQMSYIFVAHPDDEFESWSVVEQSSGNYHVFVLLTRGGHTGYCENPATHPNTDRYAPAPKGSEQCKANRVTSWHKFLNRAAATDPYLDVLDQTDPVVSDTDPVVGRYEVWAGPNSARFVFDFPDGGLAAANLVAANALVRSTKGTLIPDLPDYQALAGSFWNANYPDCIKYEHPDHRAVHAGVWNNDLDTTVRRGRTCATDPDATYFRRIPDATWAVLAGSPDYLATGNGPGIFRESYAWLNAQGWEMSEGDTTFNARSQSFWELR